MSRAGTALRLTPVDGIGEVGPGTDIAGLLEEADLRDGDVVLVTSKVVAKAEGRVSTRQRDEVVAAETVRVVARRGPASIVRNPQGLVMAAAGVDASNVARGQVVLLPEDSDASAAALRARLYDARGVNVAVLVTDTAGRPWRHGQTDIAVGAAGLLPLDDHAGRVDAYGNPLAVTAPAVADELAGAAELAAGKLDGRPVVVARGLAGLVLPPGDHGPGAVALQRPLEQDMFALGAREAAVAAALGEEADCFGPPAGAEEVAQVLTRAGVASEPLTGPDPGLLVRPAVDAVGTVRSLAHAHSWQAGDLADSPGALVLTPMTWSPPAARPGTGP